MNTTEELDDFEIAIREKLSNYELTPPVGTWNNIVNSQSNERRKLRIVWFNNSSFLLVFLCSMFSMWLAFGSINFDLNNYKTQEFKMLDELSTSRQLLFSSNKSDITFNKQMNYVEESNISGYVVIEKDKQINDLLTESSNLYPVNMLLTTMSYPEDPIPVLTPIDFQREAIKYRSMFHWNMSLVAGSQILFNNNLLNNIDDKQLSNGKSMQISNKIELAMSYSISPKVQFNIGLGVSDIHQKNSFIKTIESTHLVLDSTILGYIQDPVTGRTPVYDIKERDVTEIEKNNIEFRNKLYSLDIPVMLDWRVIRKNRFGLSLNAGIRATHLIGNNYTYLNKEGVVEVNRSFNRNILTTSTGIELNYFFNSKISTYLSANFSKSSAPLLNNGASIGVGLKYKFY